MFTRTLVLSLILSLFSSFVSAQDATLQPACGGIQPVDAVIKEGVKIRCSCNGGEVIVEAKQEWPGGKLGGSFSSDDKLVCIGYILTPGYDTFTPQGNAAVAFDSFSYSIISTPKCNTSDCGQFLGFLWTIGTAKCDEQIFVETGGHGLYKIIGECPGPEGPMTAPNFRGPTSSYPLFISPAGRNQ